MTNQLESPIENRFVKEVEADGTPCIKLSSRRGFNDRMVMLPPPQCFVIEFKRPGVIIGKRKGEKLQLHIHKELKKLGWAVYVTDNYEEAISIYNRHKGKVRRVSKKNNKLHGKKSSSGNIR